ncbi:TldD/PmbA family protein [Pontibacter harenae]|uniref:TldD/PmbA family protein n=1 Tax=Pontibacter harenae TaxID=2894083 RepID=UPI001E442572|nr:TldD/PmbA family protein [Pontibacter harenae]MCC9169023.1 TldD/PmbA family protein [Pontibacter harenae]
MAVLSKEEAQIILTKALQLSKADECEAMLSGSIEGNIRSARNSVSTAGEKDKMTLSVSVTYGKKTGYATTNEFDDSSLERVMRRAEELAMLSPENPEYMPLLGPQTYKEAITFSPTTASVASADRAEAVAQSLKITKAANLEAAGFLNNTTSFVAKQNSKGLFAYNKETDVSFSVTARNQEGTGSGHVSQSFHDFSKLDTAAQTKIAAHKAMTSAGAQAVEPGRYTVILEPLAASGLIRFLMNGFDARSADEGRSFMSKKGGGTRLGEQLFNEKVTIYSDPLNSELPSPTWNSDGIPLDKNTWVKNGIVESLSYSRYWADKKGVKPQPAAAAIIMEGGDGSVEDLIKETQKGILVTRFWYTRMVDPQTLTLTGLTRDGTFYIENGRIKFPVKNFRFNESPIIMLNNLEVLGKPVRSGNMIIPPMKIRDFTFTSLSDAV